MELVVLITTFALPPAVLVLPFLLLWYRIRANDLQLILSRKQLLKFFTVGLVLALPIFLLLMYLTGDLAYFHIVAAGYYPVSGGFVFNIGNHISFAFQFNPGLQLLAVSLLTGILYSSLLVLPPVCTYSPTEQQEKDQYDGKGTSLPGSFSAMVSAIASTTVCCSTSVVAIIAPTVLTFLGPFAPILIYVAMGLLVYSLLTIVFPRFPVSDNF